MFVPVGWVEPYQTLAAAYTASGDTELAEWADAMAAGTDRRQRRRDDTSPGVDRTARLALDAMIGLGQIAEVGGDPTAAADWYRKALEVDAESQAAKLGLGRVSDGTQGHPSIEPSPSAEGSN